MELSQAGRIGTARAPHLSSRAKLRFDRLDILSRRERGCLKRESDAQEVGACKHAPYDLSAVAVNEECNVEGAGADVGISIFGALIAIVMVLAMLAIPVVVIVAVVLGLRRKSAGGGLSVLAARYAYDGPAKGEVRQWQSVRVGAVNYNNIATVGADEAGFYLSVLRTKVFVPWSEVRGVQRGGGGLVGGYELTVGEQNSSTEGTVVWVTGKTFEMMQRVGGLVIVE